MFLLLLWHSHFERPFIIMENSQKNPLRLERVPHILNLNVNYFTINFSVCDPEAPTIFTKYIPSEKLDILNLRFCVPAETF